MKNATVSPPTPEIIATAEAIERAIGSFLERRPSIAEINYFEASVEAHNLLNLAVRHLESIIELARRDLVLLPAAAVLARAAMETSFRVLWLLHREGPYEREARWLAYIRDEESTCRRVAKLLDEIGSDGSKQREAEVLISEFRKGVESKMPRGITPPKELPKFRSMLEGLGELRKYAYYIILSQYAHGTNRAGGLYRQHLGSMKQFGEFISAADWKLVFVAAWGAFEAASKLMMVRCKDGRPAFDDEILSRVRRAIEATA